MPVVLLIATLLLGGRVYLRHRRRQPRLQGARHEDAQRWEDDGGALRATGEQPHL
jgi:hypothetical protein